MLRHPLTHVRAGRYRTRTARAERSEGNQSPSGALISARFPTHRNVYRDGCRFGVDGTGLEQQRRRPPPAAETGSRGWGRVLIFQSPAKGLRKNQQTQPVALLSPRFPTRRNVYRDDCRFVVDGTGLEPGQAKAGYPHEGGILPFANFNSVWYTRIRSTNRNLSGRGPSILLMQDRSVA